VDIASVGAGGGSIVWRDAGGMLRVGPRSAGAAPGPACYGRGGTAPTITDAHVIRGSIQPASFLGGRMRLDADAARRAFQPLAAEMGMSVEVLADSAIRLADANVVRAIQLISTELGRDPRDYALVPFGGAGPLHAGRIAEDLGIRRIVVPQNAGVLSAFGLLAADFTQYDTVTRRMPVDDAAPEAVREVLHGLRERLEERFRSLGIRGDLGFAYTLQMRFIGQAFEVDVALPQQDLARLDAAALLRHFEHAHRLVYMDGGGAGLAGRRVEIVGFRVGATAPEKPVSAGRPSASASRALRSVRIHENREVRECSVTTRAGIAAAGGMAGPLLAEDETATIYIPPGWQATADDSGNLILIHTGDTK
jgi:N-methylhydantoinase A